MDSKSEMRGSRRTRLCLTLLVFAVPFLHPVTIAFGASARVEKSSSSVQLSKSAQEPSPTTSKFRSLWDTWKTLSGKKFIDLTHAFEPGIPGWAGFPDEKRRTIYEYNKDGFLAEQYTFVGQWGTHVDPPVHFHQGLRSVDEIPVNEMILPLVVIDMSKKAAENPDLLLSVDDFKSWESKYGKIPEGAFVVMRTDWARRWPDVMLMQNKDPKGVMHYPGWSMEAIRFLVDYRGVTGVGHETTDTDGGENVSRERYPAETYILGENKFQIELLADLDQLPEYGAIVVVSFPKPKKGSGFPARVFAILP